MALPHAVRVLDAAMTVAEARLRLEGWPDRAFVVIRREFGAQVFFYPYLASDIRDRFGPPVEHDAHEPVVSRLNLHEWQAASTAQVEEAVVSTDPVVLLDGDAVIGVQADGVEDALQRLVVEELESHRTHVGWAGSGEAPADPADAGGTPGPAPDATPESPVGPDIGLKPLPDSLKWKLEKGLSGFLGDEESGSAGRTVTAPAPAPPQAPKPIEAFPYLDAPDAVTAGVRFEVEIGLAREAVAGVMGGIRTERPESGVLELEATVVADGFDAPEGWTHALRIPTSDLDAGRIRVPLVPRDPGGAPRLTMLLVHFSRGGVPCGVGSRKIVVMRAGASLPPAQPTGAEWASSGPAGGPVTLAQGGAADLTIRIDKPDRNQASGRFTWTVLSPHPVALAAEPVHGDLGSDSASFARTLIDGVTQNEGQPTLDGVLRGIGLDVADRVPVEVWEALDAVAAHLRAGDPDAIPSVLLLSAEPHVPWELAVLDPPLFDDRPPFLGAQANVSRWISGERAVAVPPPAAKSIRRMAVVAGDYQSARGLRPLPHAEEEAKALAATYGATSFPADHESIARLLDGAPGDAPGAGGAEAIHFACHGEVDARNPRLASIFLNDESVLSPHSFRSARIGKTHRPFLFLNACQVGQAAEELGGYAGFAGAALRAGFSGVVAPLWKVEDDVARDIALEFYREAFEPTPVAEILRTVRARYAADGKRSSWLAYVYYGHPNLLLEHG